MLRNGSRAVTSKQAIMADHSSLPSSSSQNHTRPISSFFGSPRFFHGFLAKAPSETETMSPTSILDSKPFYAIANPFGYDNKMSKFHHTLSENKHCWENSDSKGIGLALIDSLNDEKTCDNFSKPNTRMVLFGSKLKIKIPPLPALSPGESPKSPADFGIKTRNSQILGTSSPFGSLNSVIQTQDSPLASTGCLSMSEMELSEDYTCVISHGPNPKTTHIYGNCVLENCCGIVSLSELKNENCTSTHKFNSPWENFLSFCYTCKKNLGQGKDIYMYRGEKAFCSRECRGQEMLFDGVENSESDDAL
uniref:FLZ-type domain-containing protein n=1 Tax=Davidia involucrata TaxID=16924 RepID=A0A5B6YG64_DAVIN